MAEQETVQVTGDQYEIEAGPYRATVTGLGAGLRQLSHGGNELILSYAGDDLPPNAAGQIMIPWPNRIDRGIYHFQGEERRLDINDHIGGNANHGLTRWAPWRLVSADTDRVALGYHLLGYPGYPHVLDLLLTYALTPDSGLTVTLTCTNRGRRSAPFGYGAHPYLVVDSSTIDECGLEFVASTRLRVSNRGIPTRTDKVLGTTYDFSSLRRIGAMRIDSTFGQLQRDGQGRAKVRLQGRERSVVLWQDESLQYVQIFTAEPLSRRALAIEPMTCPPNAFRTGDHLIVLDPGAATTHSFGIQIGRQ